MPDTTFETLLSRQLREYAEAGVRPIDRFAIAEETIASGGTVPRWRRGWSLAPMRGNRLLVPLLVALLLAALATGIALVGARLLPMRHAYLNEFIQAPDLPIPMDVSVLVPLADGRVLVIGAGSYGEDWRPTALLYNAATGVSTSAGPNGGLFVGSAVRLLDGRVLIVTDGVPRIFDPTSMRLAAVEAMVDPRVYPAVALLHDGRVLVAGGSAQGVGDKLSSAELFDPGTLTFSPTGPMGTPGYEGPMATLPDGRVFAAPLPTAEVYDPSTGRFSAAGTSRGHDGDGTFGVNGAIVIPDGRVVVVGSTGVVQHGRISIWDPTSRTFSPSDNPPGPVRSATLLDDGRILLIGGRGAGQSDPVWAGIYDPTTGVTVPIDPPAAVFPAMTRLADGRVLLVGGLADGELHQDPVSGVYDTAPAVPTVQIFR
jgi:hypothetical protein